MYFYNGKVFLTGDYQPAVSFITEDNMKILVDFLATDESSAFELVYSDDQFEENQGIEEIKNIVSKSILLSTQELIDARKYSAICAQDVACEIIEKLYEAGYG